MTRIAILIIFLVALAQQASALDQILAWDVFDSYAGGTLPTTGNGSLAAGSGWSIAAGDKGWFMPAGLTPFGQIAAPGIGATGGRRLETVDVGGIGRRLRSALVATAPDPIWFAFKLQGVGLQATATTLATNDNTIRFMSGGWTVPSTVFSLNTSGTRTTVGNLIRWRLSGTDNPAWQTAADDFAHLVVLKIEAGQVTAWFDPSLASVPDPTLAIGTIALGSTSFDRILITAAKDTVPNPDAISVMQIDDVIAGIGWRSVSDPTMPIITSVTPNVCYPSGIQYVWITGRGFQSTNSSSVGGYVNSGGYVGPALVQAYSGTQAAGTTVDVQVFGFSPGAVASLTDCFTFSNGTPSDPALVWPPHLTSNPRPGETVYINPGVWSPAQSSFSYQWQSADNTLAFTDIPGATGASYSVQLADLGRYFRARVTAGNTVALTGPIQSLITKPAQRDLYDFEGPTGPKCGSNGVTAVLLVSMFVMWRRRRA